MMLPWACTDIEEPFVGTEDSEDSYVDGGEVSGTAVIISATSAGITKAALNGSNGVCFESTDMLSVFDGGLDNCEFTVKELYPDGSADFQGTVGSSGNLMPVVYPYQKDFWAEIYGPAKTLKIHLSIPAEQTAVAGTFDPSAAISIGLAESVDEGTVRVGLSNMCALAKFTMPEGNYSKVVLSTNNGETLGGSCFVDILNGISDLYMTETVSKVTLAGEIVGGQTYYVSVAPAVASNGITVRIYDKDGNLAGEKSTSKSVEFKKNTILNLGTLPDSDTEEWLGNGTAESPYIISTVHHLELLSEAYSTRASAQNYAGKYFKQIKDINMGGKPFTIGNYHDDDQFHPGFGATFNAHYDGGGHTISDYALVLVDDSYQNDYNMNNHAAGLFNVVKDATISNLTVSPAAGANNYVFTSKDLDDTEDQYYIGLLVGLLAGDCTISNCHTAKRTYKFECGTISSLDNPMNVMVGGLVGCSQGVKSDFNNDIVRISNCTNAASLIVEGGRGILNVGGMLGSVMPHYQIVYMDRCRNTGKMSVYSEYAGVFAGGLIGRAYNTSEKCTFRVSSSVNEGSINAETNASKDACAGGIIGSQYSDGDFSHDPWFHNCLNKGDIYARGNDAMSGGICAYCYDTDTVFALCINVGHISADGDPRVAPISVKEGKQCWCYWLDQEAFKGYIPDGDYYNCRLCEGFIVGNGSGVDNPEYVRLHGKSGDYSGSKTLYSLTKWEEPTDWNAAASWTGTSNSYWGEREYLNELDLVF